MRNFTFKGLLLTAVFMLLGCLSIQAANDGSPDISRGLSI